MNIFLAFILISISLLLSCSDQTRSNQDIATQIDNINGEEIIYEKKLSSDDVDFNIYLAGEGDIKFLDIRASAMGNFVGKIDYEIEGSILSAMISDLNSNSKPEIILLINPNSSSNLGMVSILGFEYKAKTFTKFQIPDIDNDFLENYAGNDRVALKPPYIVREFDIIKMSNGKSYNSTKTILYKLDDNLKISTIDK